MNKKEIERKARNIKVPKDEDTLKVLDQIRERHPKAYRKLIKKLKKAFPDKDFDF
jgi:hypothetical protein